MRFIDEQVRIEAAVTRIDGWEGSQPPSPNWPLGKHSQAIFGDLQTHARTQISEASQHLSLAYENQQSQDQDAQPHGSQRQARASSLRERQGCEQCHFENESKHSSARSGKENRAGHQYGASADQDSLSSSQEMPHTEHKGNR